MDHWGCKSMAWSTPIEHNVRFFSVLISLASQVVNYLENGFILFKSKYISTERLIPTWFKVQLLHSRCVYGKVQHQGQQRIIKKLMNLLILVQWMYRSLYQMYLFGRKVLYYRKKGQIRFIDVDFFFFLIY